MGPCKIYKGSSEYHKGPTLGYVTALKDAKNVPKVAWFDTWGRVDPHVFCGFSRN